MKKGRKEGRKAGVERPNSVSPVETLNHHVSFRHGVPGGLDRRSGSCAVSPRRRM